MQKQIQNTIEKVSNGPSSLFTREDVIKLLTDLDAEMQLEVPKPQINKKRLLYYFKDVLLGKDFNEAIDTDNIELSLDHNNRVQVKRISIDEDFIIDLASDALDIAWETIICIDDDD